jgi:hypothetical protein
MPIHLYIQHSLLLSASFNYELDQVLMYKAIIPKFYFSFFFIFCLPFLTNLKSSLVKGKSHEMNIFKVNSIKPVLTVYI